MSDTIYREDAIKALRCEYPAMPIFKELREEWAIKTEGFRKAEEVIMSIPSADRPQGKWVLSVVQHEEDTANGNYAYICSNCHHTDVHAKTMTVPFCWYCGAEMEGADDE